MLRVCNTIELFFEICGPERFLSTFHLAFDSDRLPHLVITTKTKNQQNSKKWKAPRKCCFTPRHADFNTYSRQFFSETWDLLSRVTDRRSPVISNFPPNFNSENKTKHKIQLVICCNHDLSFASTKCREPTQFHRREFPILDFCQRFQTPFFFCCCCWTTL